MNFKSIKRTVREICYFRKIIKQYGHMLQPGKYHLFSSLRAIAADNPISMEYAKVYFEKKKAASKATVIVSWINQNGYYWNKKKSDLEKYEAVYSANNYDKEREIKLFSFDRKEILTICTTADICKKQLSEFDKLHDYFGMPRLTKQTGNDRGYKISMVTLQPRPGEDQTLESIARCCGAYYTAHPAEANTMPVSQIIDFSYDSQELCQWLEELVGLIGSGALTLEIPLCLQHGDLSRDNLIYGTCDGTTDFWWIDWEHAGERLFFYDYFFYILNTAVYFSDTQVLKAYLCGQYDDYLAQFFTKFGLEYNSGCRKDYFLIFAVAFLKERVCDRGNVRAMKMYYDFIKQMVSE